MRIVSIKALTTYECECNELRCRNTFRIGEGVTQEELQNRAERVGWSFIDDMALCPHHTIQKALDDDPNAELRVMCRHGHGLMYMVCRDVQGVETYKCTGCPEEQKIKVSGGLSNLWPRKTA